MPDQETLRADAVVIGDSFLEYVLAFFQGLFRPAFMVYEVFAPLGS